MFSALSKVHLNHTRFDRLGCTFTVRSLLAFRYEFSTTAKSRKQDEIFERVLVKTLTCATKVYDIITLPVYAAIQQPWKKLAAHNSPKSLLICRERMEYATYTPVGLLHRELDANGVDTMEKVFAHAIGKNGDRNCLGSRDIISEEEFLDQQTGKMMKRYELGDYNWISYSEVGALAQNLSGGFASLGIQPKGKIAVMAETRKEWMLTAMGAFRRNLNIVTIFITLGDDGIVHALSETEAPCLVTTEEMMPRCENILKQVPSVKTVIYMDINAKRPVEEIAKNLPEDVQVISFSDLIERGRLNPVEDVKPQPNDRAIIMYTSGSTGYPKGVILSHHNLTSGLKAVLDVLDFHDYATERDKYIAYLPLAHVFELMTEAVCFVKAIPIGYSSALTLTDQSPAIKPGTKGDASVLKPTTMAGVPLVLERITKAIQAKIANQGRVPQIMFDFFYKYKTEWVQKGYDTPIVNKVFFEKIRQIVGGRLQLMVVGSAPLAPETHEFMRTVLCCPVCQGYAMTESSSCGTFSVAHDLSVGRVGPPMFSNNIRLVNWEEGGYRVTDQPYPRGEVLLGGDNIALGYYKMPDHEDFFVDDGKRWIRTGDIGEVHPDGCFKIIDRKKDLVKLSNGEYVSLGRIESVIKSSVIIENACACADSSHEYPVVLIVPVKLQVEKLASKMGIREDSYEKLCQNPAIEHGILEEVQKTSRRLHLNKHEIPRKIRLCPEPWLPESGLVTGAYKIKRNHVYKHFEREINEMYNSSS